MLGDDDDDDEELFDIDSGSSDEDIQCKNYNLISRHLFKLIEF